mgnify:CR=1 FL=1
MVTNSQMPINNKTNQNNTLINSIKLIIVLDIFDFKYLFIPHLLLIYDENQEMPYMHVNKDRLFICSYNRAVFLQKMLLFGPFDN